MSKQPEQNGNFWKSEIEIPNQRWVVGGVETSTRCRAEVAAESRLDRLFSPSPGRLSRFRLASVYVKVPSKLREPVR